jgi:hypothetical protein
MLDELLAAHGLAVAAGPKGRLVVVRAKPEEKPAATPPPTGATSC